MKFITLIQVYHFIEKLLLFNVGRKISYGYGINNFILIVKRLNEQTFVDSFWWYFSRNYLCKYTLSHYSMRVHTNIKLECFLKFKSCACTNILVCITWDLFLLSTIKEQFIEIIFNLIFDIFYIKNDCFWFYSCIFITFDVFFPHC